MRALVTNDDGFDAPGLRALLQVCIAAEIEPLVVAPRCPSSGASRARQSNVPYDVQRIDIDGITGFAVEGSPAACVVFALNSGLVMRPDLCLSGINAGENLGAELTVSGTFGAALEAASAGIPAIALSREAESTLDPGNWNWDAVLLHATHAIERCLADPVWLLANVNIPNSPASSELAFVSISHAPYFWNRYSSADSTMYSGRRTTFDDTVAGEDVYAFGVESRITVSLIADFFTSAPID